MQPSPRAGTVRPCRPSLRCSMGRLAWQSRVSAVRSLRANAECREAARPSRRFPPGRWQLPQLLAASVIAYGARSPTKKPFACGGEDAPNEGRHPMSTIRILFVDESCTDAELAQTELEQAGVYAQSLTVGDEDSLR